MVSQNEFTLSGCAGRAVQLGVATGPLWRRRRTSTTSAFPQTATLLALGSRVCREMVESERIQARAYRISTTDFNFNFNAMGDGECLINFRLIESDVIRIMKAVAWPPTKYRTERNGYRVDPLLATCVVLHHVSSPARWVDLEEFFGKWSALSEIFWESLEAMVDTNGRRLLMEGSMEMMTKRASAYATAIFNKCGALEVCVGLIDGTVIQIARPKGYKRQKVCYNGHKRSHALKFQAVTTPDGMFWHAAGPIEGRRHDWTMHMRSGLGELLPELLTVESYQYCLYGDSGYNHRWYLEVPCQGSNLNQYQTAFNVAMASGRVTVEWMFKELNQQFSTVDIKRKMKLLEAPIGLLYVACMFLSNCRTCIYQNQTSLHFKCPPPALEEYLA